MKDPAPIALTAFLAVAILAMGLRLPLSWAWLPLVALALEGGLFLTLRPTRRTVPHPAGLPNPSTEGVLRSLSNLLIVATPEGGIRAVNGATCRALGYTHEELTGQPLERVVAGTLDPAMLAAGGRSVEAVYRSRDGSLLPVLITGSVLAGEQGSVDAVVLMAQDITLHKQYTAQLRSLVDRLLRAQEEERRRLAHDLHDGMLQYVIAAELQVQSARKSLGEAAPGLERGVEHLRAAVQEGRRLIDNLRPASLDQFGLVEALRRDLEGSDLQVDLTVELGEQSVPDAIETGLFRIVQEGLSNVRKHSGSRRVEVRLSRVGQEIQLLIRDQGCGFDPARVQAGVGLSGMKQRAELLGGWLEVSSQPGRGASLRAGFPLSEPAEPAAAEAPTIPDYEE